MEAEFQLSVNGAERVVTCEPDTPLLDVLRHDLGFTGPGFGCGIGRCGTCFVLIDGRARSSCDLPVSAVGGPITTVEGLATDKGLHAVQQAFIDEQAAQCGYCTSGMVMAAVGLLRDHPSPSEQQVREALEGNLCRCGAQGRIVRAVLKGAGEGSGAEAAVARSPNGEVVPSRVPTRGAKPGEGPRLAPPDALARPAVAESGVPSNASPGLG